MYKRQGYIWSQNQKKEQDYAKMEITFQKDRQILEYGEKIDSRSFVKDVYKRQPLSRQAEKQRLSNHV